MTESNNVYICFINQPTPAGINAPLQMKNKLNITRLNRLQNFLSVISRKAIEITIRGEKQFTFSFEGENTNSLNNLVNYFSGHGKIESGYDKECDMSFVYLNL